MLLVIIVFLMLTLSLVRVLRISNGPQLYTVVSHNKVYSCPLLFIMLSSNSIRKEFRLSNYLFSMGFNSSFGEFNDMSV